MTCCVLQPWVHDLSLMQQTVLLTAIRGPDNATKYTSTKSLLRWYRRCILISAFDRAALDTPYDQRGGSFTGPTYQKVYANGRVPDALNVDWEKDIEPTFAGFLKDLDMLPHHFLMHFIHAMEILGYKHPIPRIRQYWHAQYNRLVRDFHMNIESERELDERLGDSEEQWKNYNEEATRA